MSNARVYGLEGRTHVVQLSLSSVEIWGREMTQRLVADDEVGLWKRCKKTKVGVS